MGLRVQVLTIVMSCCGIAILATEASAQAGPPMAASTGYVVDVALGAEGQMAGQVLDAQGGIVPGAVVSIRFGEAEIARCVTDAKGRYAVKNLRGGLHHVVCGDVEAVFRLWSPEAAPPRARSVAMLISQSRVVRGQFVEGLNLVNGTALGLGLGGLVIALDNSSDIDDLKKNYSGGAAAAPGPT